MNTEAMNRNLATFVSSPSEAMTAILRGQGWMHPELGVGHDFVKHSAREAKKQGKNLLETALDDSDFAELHDGLTDMKTRILNGDAGQYLGSAKERLKNNVFYAQNVCKFVPSWCAK